MAKRTNPFWTILSVVLIVALVACGFAFKTEIKALFSGQKLYTKSQYDDAYNQGKKSGEAESKYNYELASGYKKDLEKEKQKSKERETLITKLEKLNEALANENTQLTNKNEDLKNNNTRLNELVNNYLDLLQLSISENQAIVTYVVNNKAVKVDVIEKGSKITNPYIVTFKEGDLHTFNYWTNEGQQVDLNTFTITTNTFLVASITYRYTITFVDGDSTVLTNVSTKGSLLTLPEDVSKVGYTFLGYYVDGALIDPQLYKVTGNVTVELKYQIKTFTVTFKTKIYHAADGTNIINGEDCPYYTLAVIDTVTIKYGETIPFITAPADPSGSGKKFSGWYYCLEEYNLQKNYTGKEKEFSLMETRSDFTPSHSINLYALYENDQLTEGDEGHIGGKDNRPEFGNESGR